MGIRWPVSNSATGIRCCSSEMFKSLVNCNLASKSLVHSRFFNNLLEYMNDKQPASMIFIYIRIGYWLVVN